MGMMKWRLGRCFGWIEVFGSIFTNTLTGGLILLMTYYQITDVAYENRKYSLVENIHSFDEGNNGEKNWLWESQWIEGENLFIYRSISKVVNVITEENFMEKRLKEIKNEFYEFCGMLSLDEIVGNPDLIRTIEEIERLILSMEECWFLDEKYSIEEIEVMRLKIEKKFQKMFSQVSKNERNQNRKLLRQEVVLKKLIDGLGIFIKEKSRKNRIRSEKCYSWWLLLIPL